MKDGMKLSKRNSIIIKETKKVIKIIINKIIKKMIIINLIVQEKIKIIISLIKIKNKTIYNNQNQKFTMIDKIMLITIISKNIIKMTK
jgi:hypothetical protein